jgi:hypothetical protein
MTEKAALSPLTALSPLKDLLERLRAARWWLLAQFAGTAALLLLGLLWTRLPEKHLWQVLLSLLLPALLAISVLELEAGTMRRLLTGDGRRVKLVWGAATLLVWLAALGLAWAVLDWADGRIFLWTSYLNSKAPAQMRVTLLSFEHLLKAMTFLEWVLRWIALPGKLIVLAVASAEWGWRLPWRRVGRVLWNWRWWPAVIAASLLAVWLPSHFFTPEPHGSVTAQVWSVGLKLAAAYLLAVSSWVLLLAWCAVLFARQQKPPVEETLVAVPVVVGPEDRADAAQAELPPPADESRN